VVYTILQQYIALKMLVAAHEAFSNVYPYKEVYITGNMSGVDDFYQVALSATLRKQ
jgi:hypothetical protein